MSDTAHPIDMQKAGEKLADILLGLSEQKRMDELAKLKAQNVIVHAIVVNVLKERQQPRDST